MGGLTFPNWKRLEERANRFFIKTSSGRRKLTEKDLVIGKRGLRG